MVYNKLGGKMNRPPIKIDCLKRPLAGINAPYDIKGGEAWNYLTPEQWPFPMLDSDPVWIPWQSWTDGVPDGQGWNLAEYHQCSPNKTTVLIARAGQPKPSNLWRPK